MNMSIPVLSTSALQAPFILAGGACFIYIIVSSIQEIKPIEYKEIFFYFIKTACYLGLASFIFVYHKNKQSIDVLTYYTYLLCILEVAHNGCNCFGNAIAAMLKLLFSIIKDKCFSKEN